ncbi:MAG: thioredoxin family protein [Alphaproteobacteria bacterium]|nr:thioredoxin family protein [Alphaproteobacteria bacterium]
MKKFWLVFLLWMLFPLGGQCEQSAQVSDKPYFAGEDIDIESSLKQLLEAAKYFDENYPREKIGEDMSEDIKKMFPGIEEHQIYDFQLYIREGLGAYRYFKDIYNDYVEKMLTPEEPPLIVDDNQYADKAPEYIEAGDNAVVITDIKTVVPYSQNMRDLKSYHAKIARDSEKNNKKGDFDDLLYITSRMDLKKIPLYDVIYPSPLTGRKGIGKWDKRNEIKARIISEQTGVREENKIRAAINFLIPKDKFIIANDGQYAKPQINFEKSENIKNIEILPTLKGRLISPDRQDWSVYRKEMVIPITMEIEDNSKPVTLRAEINAVVCDLSKLCQNEIFNPELELRYEYSRKSSVATFIAQIHEKFAHSSQELSIIGFRVKNLPYVGNFLEAEIAATSKIKSLNAFIDSPDKIAFEAPRISIDNQKAVIRFLPLEADVDLSKFKFELSMLVNDELFLNTAAMPENDMSSVPVSAKISWNLIVLAFIGGFILNFMPCVFPVLSVKLLSLTKFGARNSSAVRRNFYYTVSGIFASMFFLASILALLKYCGKSIGWGMQFQNPYFIITMIFAVLIFMLIIQNIIIIALPEVLQKKIYQPASFNLPHFLTGCLIVMMATPCTAPYLGTAVGFALSGSIIDIYGILTAVALGIALPYIIMYIFPQLIIFMPRPGEWMNKLNTVMCLALFITLIWLMSVLYAQTNGWFILRLSLYLFICALLLGLNALNRDKSYDFLDIAARSRVRKKIKHIIISGVMVLFALSLIDGGFSYRRHALKTEEITSSQIDTKQINEYIAMGKTVIVAVGADWCLTCKYNDFAVWNLPSMQDIAESDDIKIIKIDWTEYDRDVLSFMEKYHRSGLPFYVLFSPLAPDGIVLPEILNHDELLDLISNFSLRQVHF